jgi:hypothetical protein
VSGVGRDRPLRLPLVEPGRSRSRGADTRGAGTTGADTTDADTTDADTTDADTTDADTTDADTTRWSSYARYWVPRNRGTERRCALRGLPWVWRHLPTEPSL